MEFRWIAVIALWTLLSGPIFSPPSGGPAARAKKVAAAPAKPSSPQAPFRAR